MKTTKVYAKEVFNLWKDKARCFNGAVTEGQFETMLQAMGFGQADAIVITMAMVLAGAKFSHS